MALERTLSIVKPDGVARNLIGQVIGRFEKVGLKVVAARMVHLSQRDAEGFYAVHAARPFFKDLVKYMTSGPVLVQVLEGEDAIAKNREDHGRHRSEEGRAGHDPRRSRREHRSQHRARLGLGGKRRERNRVLLPHDRALPARLICNDRPPPSPPERTNLFGLPKADLEAFVRRAWAASRSARAS